jgi:hypothetical protein
MASIHYNGRTFRSVNNSANGEVNGETLFHYHQQGQIVWATYQGGAIQWGTLIAQVDANGGLEMRYQHINTSGHLMTGECHSTPEILPDGRLRLHEKWLWTSGDRSAGESTVEEMIS